MLRIRQLPNAIIVNLGKYFVNITVPCHKENTTAISVLCVRLIYVFKVPLDIGSMLLMWELFFKKDSLSFDEYIKIKEKFAKKNNNFRCCL